MKVRISKTILEELEEACSEARGRVGSGHEDPSDPVYIKIASAKKSKSGCLIDVDHADITELRSRAEFDIETCQENLGWGVDLPYWRGRLAAYRALLRQIK